MRAASAAPDSGPMPGVCRSRPLAGSSGPRLYIHTAGDRVSRQSKLTAYKLDAGITRRPDGSSTTLPRTPAARLAARRPVRTAGANGVRESQATEDVLRTERVGHKLVGRTLLSRAFDVITDDPEACTKIHDTLFSFMYLLHMI